VASNVYLIIGDNMDNLFCDKCGSPDIQVTATSTRPVSKPTTISMTDWQKDTESSKSIPLIYYYTEYTAHCCNCGYEVKKMI
jgi:hypothetical protein